MKCEKGDKWGWRRGVGGIEEAVWKRSRDGGGVGVE